MKKIIIISFLLAIATFSFAQQTFTSKKEALNYLNQTFSKYFIKSEVQKQEEGKEYRLLYDYEITEIFIKIHTKYVNNFGKDVDYMIMKFGDINGVDLITKNEKLASYFKNSTALNFRSKYPSFQSRGSSNYSQMFPFELTKTDNVQASIIEAINTITREDKAIAKVAQQKIIEDDRLAFLNQEQEIKGKLLPNYEIFTSENIKINLRDYIDKNRPFKNKPLVLVTWSNKWCPICVIKIDSLLKSGVALNYNIVLVNKEDRKADFSVLKIEILNHTPNYNKDAILLFDKDNQLEPIDKNSAPFFIWLDKNLKIIRSFSGYAINVSTINNILAEIE